MSGPDSGDVWTIRRAVRHFLAEPDTAKHLASGAVGVAVSGGADSLALTEAAAHVGHRMDLRVHAVVVDHGLQDDSAAVAETAAAHATRLGADTTDIRMVAVHGPGGPEAAARKARYAALRDALPAPDALMLLGHTLDDQAETVLLGLGRGSGPRSVAGMRALNPPWGRPLLAVPRATTHRACAALGITPWQDPHNSDPRFTRVRLRSEVFPLLDDVLGGGVAGALARTAAQLREDGEVLDALAEHVREKAIDGETILTEILAAEPAALRRRVLREWLLSAGVRELTDAHLRAVDDLIGAWRGQGAVWLPGKFEAFRAHGRLAVRRADEPGGHTMSDTGGGG